MPARRGDQRERSLSWRLSTMSLSLAAGVAAGAAGVEGRGVWSCTTLARAGGVPPLAWGSAHGISAWVVFPHNPRLMADLRRRFDRDRDLPALLVLIAAARTSAHPRAFLHPGGLQWLLRLLTTGALSVRQWSGDDALAGFLVNHAGYVIAQSADPSLDKHLWLLDQAEGDLRRTGEATIETSVWDGDDALRGALWSRGYVASGTFGHELVFDGPQLPTPALPDGFSMRWLEPGLDDAYVALHRAAWSTRAPSTYVRSMHDAVTAMPDFDRTLVPIVAAPDGTLAASCISWFDPRTRSAEVEPLGTHPAFRRRGLGRAIVDEVVKRNFEKGAKSVLVWGVSANPVAVHLYESSGFTSRRVLREYRRALSAAPG